MFPCNSEKRPTVKGWQSYTGACETPVYGIAVPTGYVVIDLDTYKNDTLKQQVTEFLGVNLDWEGAFLQNTKSGGQHYAFETNEVIRQGSDIRDHNGNEIKGFDIRSAGKGYICSGKGYSEQLDDDCFDYMPSLPTGLPIVVNCVNVATVTDDDDLGDFEGLLDGEMPINEVKELLNKCDHNVGNSEWVSIGMAIHSEYPGADGLDLWDEWSKGGETYKEGECAKRWTSFKQSGDVSIGTLVHMAGGIEKKKTVEKYVIDSVIADRIKKDFKQEICGIKLIIDVSVVKLILKNTYYTCAAKTFFKMFNELGQVIRVGKNEINRTLIANFGQPIQNYKAVCDAIDADEEMTVAAKAKSKHLPINLLVEILMEFHQRERITQCVDIFADKAHMNIKSNEVIESLKYAPMVIEHEMYNDEIVEAYEIHFPELYEVLNMIIASRFASSRKKCYLWINASSDWGKDLFRVCLGERAMEMSVTQIGKAIKGETVSVHIDDIVGTFALCVNEFSHINSEIKQIENSIVVAPKYMNQSTIPTYTKLFFSADDVDSLVGEYGVEAQFNNRFSMLSYTGSISEMPVFNKVGQYTFTHTLKTHVANYINKNVQAYIDKGMHEASIVADKVVTAFHKANHIGNLTGDFEDNMEELANVVRMTILNDYSEGFLPQHEGEDVYTKSSRLMKDVINQITSKSENMKVSQKWREILACISEEGVKVYRTDEGLIKGFKLNKVEIEEF